MLKHFKKNIRKIHSVFTIFLLMFQNIAPLFLLATPAYAQVTPVVSDVSLAFASDDHQLTITGSTNTDTEYLLTYDDNDESTSPEAITGTVNGTNFEENVFVGTCSSEECVEDEFTHGSLEFSESDYQADFQIIDDVLWLTRNNVSSVAQVELNKTYLAPQNNQVSVTFTSLPENPGTLNIEEIILSDEQVEYLGALSNVAYDITSSMEDGSFIYDLTLPLPEGADDTAKVVYAESVEKLNNVRETNSNLLDNKLVSEDLNHFTIFIITDDDATYSSPWIDYATQGYLNNGVHYPTTITPGETATWDFSTADPGTYKVYLSWSTHSNRTVAAPYSLTHTGGVENKLIDQEKLADQITTGGSGEWSNWYYYGEYTIDGSSNLVLTGVDNSSGSEYVIADEVLLANSSVGPSELWVDDDYDLNLNNDGHIWGYDAFDSIQDAISIAANGATVYVMEGDYQEQVIINKDLELIGIDNPRIISVDSPIGYKVPESIKTFEPVVIAFGGSETSGIISGSEQVNVTIDGFEIDGNDRTTSSGKRPTGLFLRNVIGTANNNVIHNMNVGSAETFGILVYGNSDLEVLNNNVTNYSRGGIAISGDNSVEIDPTAIVKNNTVSGPGKDEDVVWAPNGIQVGYGATGIVENNTVTGNGWPGSAWSGTAILIVDTSDVVVKGNIVENNEQALGVVDFPESLYGSAWSGVVSNVDILNNTVNSNSWGLSIANEVDGINVTGNIFSQTENDSIDVYTYADTVTPPTNVTIQENSIESSGLDGLWIGETVVDQVEAEKNWWGDASGPSGDASGLGQTIVGNATYCPWLTNSDLNNPTYGGSCLSNIQGRTFVDLADNGLLLSADGDYPVGMQDDFTIRLYDASWSVLGEQTTNTTGSVGQYKFDGLIDETDTYRVCGVQKDNYLESMPAIGQHVVDTNGNSIPSQYSDSIIVDNMSSEPDEFSRCWETTLNDNNGAYLGIGYKVDDFSPIKPVLTSPVNDALVTGNPTQSWEAIDDADHYEYESYSDELLNNKVYETTVNGNSRTVGGNQTVSFWWRVRAVDIAGNKSEWSDAWKVNIDNTAPSVPINPSHNNVIIPTNNFDFDWDDSIDTSSITYEFQSSLNPAQSDGVLTTSLWKSSTLPASMIHSSGAPDGTWYWQVRAIDAVGNTSEWSEIWNVTLDQVAPVTTLTSPSDEFTTNEGIQITGSSTDLNKVAEVNLYYSIAGEDDWQLITTLTNSGSFESFAFDYTWNPSVEGVYDIKVSGTDMAGNVENSAYAYGIVYDVTDPATPTWGTIYKGHGVVAENEIGCGEYTNNTQVTFQWNENSDSDLKGYWFGTKFNPKHQWFDAGSNVKTANMTAGNNPYFYTIIAVDNADNESTISNQCGLTLDQDAPNVEITNPASGLVTGTVDIRGTVEDDNPHHYWFVIQNSSGATVAGPGVVNDTSSFTDTSLLSWDTTLVDDGTYTIKLEARDSADNKDGGSSHWVEVTVDHTDPTSIITSHGEFDGDEIETSTFSGLIEGTATDDSSGVDHVLLSISHLGFEEEESVRKYWDATGSAWVTTQSLFSATGSDIWSYQLPEAGIVEGFYEISSHAVDKAGNVENTYTIKIVYDKTIPEVVLTIDPITPDGDRGWYRFTNPAISLTASDNYDIDKIQYQWNSTSGTWITYSASINPPGEGQNIFYYRSVDKVGNVSQVGVKEVKYDATKPAGEPLNVKVEKITSNTADASWEAPDPDDDVSFYRLSWKHEDGTVHGAETGNDDFNHQLDNLYNGVWTLYVKAMDDAGNFTEKKVDFRVGPGPSTGGSDDGDVLGVTTPEGTGVGGAFPSSTLLANAEDSESSTQSGTEDNLGETVEVTDENGEVLGSTTCSGFNSYLPLIILASIFIMIIIFEVMYQGSSLSKVLISIGLVAALVALFYLVRDGQCEIESGMLKTINNWFIGLAALTGISAKTVTSTFLKEE